MRKTILSLAALVASAAASAQGPFEEALRQIEHNSPTLAALGERMEAEKASARTGLAPADPEVELAYLRGSPSSIGGRTDVGVRQSLDFPTAYLHRARIASLRRGGAELAYKAARAELLLEAGRTLIELAHRNALATELGARLATARRLADNYAAGLERGLSTAIENNKAQLNLQTVRGALSRTEIERDGLLASLARMNGGRTIEFTAASFPPAAIPADFDEWFARAAERSPALQYMAAQVAVAERQVKLDRSLALPRLSVGYMSERVVGEHFQGVLAGVSIPLWENRGRVKEARAMSRAAVAEADDARVQLHGRLGSLHARAVKLGRDAEAYRDALARHDNTPLLDRALASGEISLVEYLLEAEYRYSAVEQLLETERDRALAVAELLAVEM